MKSKYPSIFVTIWQEALQSLVSLKSYRERAKQPVKRSIYYLIYINVVLALVAGAYGYITLKPAIESAQDYVEENWATVSYDGKNLSIEGNKTYSFTDSSSVFFKVDPNEILEDNQDIDAFYQEALLLLKDGAIVGSSGEYESHPYTEILEEPFTISKKDINKGLSSIKKLLLPALPILAFIWYMLSRLIITYLAAAMAYLFMKKSPAFDELWTMAIYALTPAILMNYITLVFFSTTGLFWAVFLVYFILAIKSLRTEA